MVVIDPDCIAQARAVQAGRGRDIRECATFPLLQQHTRFGTKQKNIGQFIVIEIRNFAV